MAAVKNDEFMNIILTCLPVSNILQKKIFENEFFLEKILDIRSSHQRLSKELEEIILYPNYDLYEENGLVKGKEHIRSIYKDIKDICNEIGITVVFTKLKSVEFNKRIFCFYKIEGQDINGLIYYNKIIKKKKEGIEDLEL